MLSGTISPLFFGQRDEHGWRYHAPYRVLPTHQRFIATDISRRDRRLHLEVEFERGSVDRGSKIGDQLAALADRIVHLAVVEAGLARMRRLGTIHCQVGLCE